MEKKILNSIVKNLEVYEAIRCGASTVSEVRENLKSIGIEGGNLQRMMDLLRGVGDEKLPFLALDGEEVKKDKDGLTELLQGLSELFGVTLSGELEKKKLTIKELSEENDSLKSENQSMDEKAREQEQMIVDLKEKLSNKKNDSLKAELERKILVPDSIKVGPIEGPIDDIFLNDPKHLLDVDKCVCRYGGELDSFYKEIPTDTDNKDLEPGHELNERNHMLRTMKRVGTKRFFGKRVRDIQEVKKIEEEVGQLFPGHSDRKKEWEKQRDRVLRNRFISLNKIIEATKLTNQEKLMMYAMNGEYHGTNIEKLLIFAANHCINADFLIYMLEEPDTCTTYENTVNFLEQFANPSEVRMKLNLARELINGDWYITGDYKGKTTKFQLVPIEEFNELREKVGLPASEFCYKEDKKKEPAPEKKAKQEDPPEKPSFVESISSGTTSSVDLPDDGFEPCVDKEEAVDEQGLPLLPFE